MISFDLLWNRSQMYGLESDWVWSSLISFDWVWSALKSYNVWSWKESHSNGLQVIRFDPLWSALKSYNVWSWKKSNLIGLQVISFDLLWSSLICFKIIMYGLERNQFNWSSSDWVWSALKFNVWSWKKSNSIGLQVIRFDLLWSTLKSYNVWSWKKSNSIGLQVIGFDLLWSAFIQLKLQYSQVIWFRDTFSRLGYKW